MKNLNRFITALIVALCFGITANGQDYDIIADPSGSVNISSGSGYEAGDININAASGYEGGNVNITTSPNSNYMGSININSAKALILETSTYGMGVRMKTKSGYIDFGPKNLSWADISTDRPKFLFNKPVGIGTANFPSGYKLAVDGSILCEEIVVMNVAADFVFKSDYKLRSLEEVESFIKVNGHLPGIAPAIETSKGVKLGDFNQTLLQKIEELTLYIIDLEKRLKNVENQ